MRAPPIARALSLGGLLAAAVAAWMLPAGRISPLALVLAVTACAVGSLVVGRTAPERIVALGALLAIGDGVVDHRARRPPDERPEAAVSALRHRWDSVLAEARRLVTSPLPVKGSPLSDRAIFDGLQKLVEGSWLRGSAALSLRSKDRWLVAWTTAPMDPESPDELAASPIGMRVRRVHLRQVLTFWEVQKERPAGDVRSLDVLLTPRVFGSADAAQSIPDILAIPETKGRFVTVAFPDIPQTTRAYEELLRARGDVFTTAGGSGGYVHFALRAPDGALMGLVTMAARVAPHPFALSPYARRGLVWIAAGLLLFIVVGPAAEPRARAAPFLTIALAAAIGVLSQKAEAPPLPLVAWTLAGVALAVVPRIGRREGAGAAIACGLLAGLAMRLGPSGFPALHDHAEILTIDPLAAARDGSALLPLAWGTVVAGLFAYAGLATPAWLPRIVAAALAIAASAGVVLRSNPVLFLLTIVPLAVPPSIRRAFEDHPRAARLAAALVVPALGGCVGYGATALGAPYQLGRWLQTEVRAEVDRLTRRRSELLASVLRHLARSAEPSAVAASGSGGDERAYLLWLMSGLPESGVDSALALYSADEDLVGSFAKNLPRDAAGNFASTMGKGFAPLEIVDRADLRRGLVGQATLPQGTGIPGLVRVAVAADLRSVPLASDRRFGRLLSARLNGSGRSVWSSTGEPVFVEPSVAAPWDGLNRIAFSAGGRSYVGIAFLLGEERLLLASETPPRLVMMGSFFGMGALGALVGLAAAALGSLCHLLGPRAAWPRVPRTPLRRLLTYRVVLYAAFLFAGLLPAQVLRFGFERAFRVRVETLGEEATRQRLRQAARTAAEVFGGDASDPLRDADLKADLLSSLMEAPVDVFEGGRLVASSRRQLVKSGVLSSYLPPEAYVALEIEGRPMALWRSDEGDMGATPVALGSPMRRGALVMPLPSREADSNEEIARATATVRVASAAATILSLLLGTALARRLARPVAFLTQSAASVSEGGRDFPPTPGAFGELATLAEALRKMTSDLASQRQELLERRRYIETILDHATSGVISLDAAGLVETANQSAVRILGTEGDLLGRSLREILAEDPALAGLREAYERYLDLPRAIVTEVDTQGDTRLRLRVTLLPFRAEGSGAGTIAILEDVSDVARASRLAAWEEVARMVAHEIKNPLTPIRLHMEHTLRILRDHDASIPPKVADAVGATVRVVLAELESLKRIASEVSLLARPDDSGDMAADGVDVDLVQLAGEIAASYGAGDAAIEVVADAGPGPAVVKGRPADLERVLRNLVQNAYEAIASSPEPRGTIRVAVRPGRIDVQDDGPGIPADRRARVFEPYFSTKDAGSGLGLALARKIVRAHGGEIELVPSERGAHFAITFGEGGAQAK